MKQNINLKVYIEISGTNVQAGNIIGTDSSDACFSYCRRYLDNPDAAPVSISLPLQSEPFSASTTRNYFEGLLPEGFLRMTVAKRMRAEENDYISMLTALGRECLGAITITDNDALINDPYYEKLSTEELRDLAREGVSMSVELVSKAHLSLAGASGKVGLYYDPENFSWYVPRGYAPSTHIVKQSHVRLDAIVANEQLALTTAKKLGIDVPESHIINLGDAQEDEVLFATKRYDRCVDVDNPRIISGMPAPQRLHQEDFAQALGIPSAMKYEHAGENYMKAMFDTVRAYSSSPIEDMLKLWDIVVYDYLIGNTDNHIKNLSLLYSPDLKQVRLAPAYDIISTCIYETSTTDMAFHIGDEFNLNKINRDSFRLAAKECGLGEKMAMSRFDKMYEGFDDAIYMATNELVDRGIIKAEDLRDQILKARGRR